VLLVPDLNLGGGVTETGTVRAVARVRNVGASEAPATTLALFDGEGGALVHEAEVPRLAAGEEAFVTAEVALPEGKHTVTGRVDRAGSIQEFDRTNNVASFAVTVGQAPPPETTPTPTPTPTSTPTPTPTPTSTPTFTPTSTPVPGGPSIQSTSRSYRVGEPVSVGGRAPDGEYCAAVVLNGTWAIGDPAPGGIVASATVVSAGGVVPETVVWVAGTLGFYDVLLLSSPCGDPGSLIVTASDAGPAPGFGVGADPIPTASRAGWVLFVALVAALGAWLLWVRRG
jgi:CARDB